ncbi:MAG: 23S rRNA (uracil(1939)-C(5))-methyltransferase RlmD, partial [Ferruginibacter sp.]
MGKKKEVKLLSGIEVTGYAAEGKALARHEGKVIFIKGAVPGDVVNLRLTKSKKDWAEAIVTGFLSFSPDRTTPFCKHFGTCGGCKWQMLPYEKQLEYKQQEALDNIQRIGKITPAQIFPIAGADDTKYYRNKLEFTFSNKRYLTEEEIGKEIEIPQQNALGYHVPRIFDKVLDIEECYLMDEVNNSIRNSLRKYALENNLEFYDIRNHTGWLRNVIIRLSTSGELMVNLCLNYEDEEKRKPLLDWLLKEVPAISTLLYTINPKFNDTIYDLEPQVYFGNGFITETLGRFKFVISPKSFFQTNTRQAEKLYSITKDFAGLAGTETVYDLYCGTGSISIFLSDAAAKIIGVEVIDEAIKDARINAEMNGIGHAEFFTGDVIKICDDAFFEKHGKPDVIITDPPRAGMHEKLVLKLLDIAAPKIVYVSCNTATQARDLALLSEKY